MPKHKLEVLTYGHRPRRFRRRLAACLFLTAILCAAVGFRYCRQQWPIWERRYWVYRCRHYLGPKNQPALHPNEYWSKLSRDGVSSEDRNVFCHEIVAHNGRRRLVIVDVDHFTPRPPPRAPPNVPPANRVLLLCWVWDASVLVGDGDWSSAVWTGFGGDWTIGDGWHCDFLNGELDPSDKSHFWFGYTLDDKHGTIDGWLCDDETVKLKIRDGPAIPY